MEQIKSKTIGNFLLKTPLCNKCLNEFEPKFRKFEIMGIKGEAIYEYNEFIKSTLYRYKGLYDVVLAPIFIERYRYYFKLKYKGYIVLPAPSSFESDKERGFNHVVKMFNLLKMPVLQAFYKKTKYKQSDLTLEEREKVKEKIGIKTNLKIYGKKILFVDDLLTTGSTMKTLIKLIEIYKPKSIKVLVMAYTTIKKDYKIW